MVTRSALSILAVCIITCANSNESQGVSHDIVQGGTDLSEKSVKRLSKLWVMAADAANSEEWPGFHCPVLLELVRLREDPWLPGEWRQKLNGGLGILFQMAQKRKSQPPPPRTDPAVLEALEGVWAKAVNALTHGHVNESEYLLSSVFEPAATGGGFAGLSPQMFQKIIIATQALQRFVAEERIRQHRVKLRNHQEQEIKLLGTVHPISMSIPARKWENYASMRDCVKLGVNNHGMTPPMPSSAVVGKTQDFSSQIPGVRSSYDARDEATYMAEYGASYFALTKKKVRVGLPETLRNFVCGKYPLFLRSG